MKHLTFILFLGVLPLFWWTCTPSAPQEEQLVVQNVLLPLEPPLSARNVQSRAVKPLEWPSGQPADLHSARLVKAEIGNPDFPNLDFAHAIRLFLVDPDGRMILLASADPVPKDQASILLTAQGQPDIRPCFQAPKLDLVLEVENTLQREEGIMLIGNFEFAFARKD